MKSILLHIFILASMAFYSCEEEEVGDVCTVCEGSGGGKMEICGPETYVSQEEADYSLNGITCTRL